MSEENKFNIKVNPKKPSKEEIRKKMDFEGAYTAYTHKAYRSSRAGFNRHSFRNRKTSMFIILAIVIGVLVFVENEKEFDAQNNDSSAITKDSLNNDTTFIKK